MELSEFKEYDPNCRQLLFDNHRWCCQTVGYQHAMPHLFGNILDLNPPGCLSQTWGYDAKRRKIMKTGVACQLDCAAHSVAPEIASEFLNGCAPPYADFGCSGLPCTDMSRAGKRLRKHGPTNSIYITHAKFVQQKRVPLLVIECTPAACLF